MSDPKTNGSEPAKKDDRWVREQTKKKHLRLGKVDAQVETLSAKIKRVNEKFEAKFQERVKPIIEEQKVLQAKVETIAKTFREKLQETTQKESVELSELVQEKQKLERGILRLSQSSVTGDKKVLDEVEPEDIAEEVAPEDVSEITEDDGFEDLMEEAT